MIKKERALRTNKKKIDFGGPIIRSERPEIRNPFQRKEDEEDSSLETEEERKAKLEYNRRLRARAMAKIAMGEHNLTREEKKAVKEEIKKSPLSRLRTLRRDRKLIRQEGRKVALKKAKKEVVKKAAEGILKAIAPYLPWILLIAFIIFLVIFSFLALTYYICEGGGMIAWGLRHTALGNLCSM